MSRLGDFQNSRSLLYPETVAAAGWALPTTGKQVFQMSL